MDVREKLVELFYDNNVMCDQKIEGLADDVMDIIAHGVTEKDRITVKDHMTTEASMNNADIIRSMSDEELAENMSDWQCWGGGLDPKDWLKWLQHPAE